MLFQAIIENWRDWGTVFQSIEAFTPLITHIMQCEQLPVSEISSLPPGTNAVFRVGKYVIKIYAPKESGIDHRMDRQTELFATKFVRDRGVPAPKMIASGTVQDRYEFGYCITEWIAGTPFAELVGNMTPTQKQAVGSDLRTCTDRINVPCPVFHDIDAIHGVERSAYFKQYPHSFQVERNAFLAQYTNAELVFVHGDLNGDNLLCDTAGNWVLIDLADAVRAPLAYEQALIAVELFDFDADLLYGYFGDMSLETLTDLILEGLLLHDFGGEVVEQHIAPKQNMDSISTLKQYIRARLEALYE